MLNFSEWDKLYYSMDESLSDDVQNWLSRNLGGRISRIDGLVSDLISIERDFAKEWEKIQMEISGMKGQIQGGEISPEEEESFRKKIKAKTQEVEKLEDLKNQKIRSLNYKVRDYVDGNPRIIKYWNLKKAEAEVEISEMLYNLSKSLSDKGMEQELYKSYIDSQEDLDKRRGEVGEIVQKETKEEERKEKIRKEDPEVRRLKNGTPNIKDLISIRPSQFSSEVGRLGKDQLRRIRKFLIDKKNIALNDLRSLRRNKSRELDSAKPGEKEKILKNYNPKIYEVGEFIDRMREKINYINDKLNN